MKLWERILRRNDYVLLDGFGMRFHPTLKKWLMHNGKDIATVGKTNEEKKWKQYALEQGKVVSCGRDSASIDAETGEKALFAWVEYPRLKIRVLHYHLDKVFVKKGDLVFSDTVIGNTGTTGNSTGIHLHLGLKKKINGVWKYIDPESYDYQEETKIVDDLSKVIDSAFKKGDKVKITGNYYATGQVIPDRIKKNIYTVSEINVGRALLKEIVSWVYLKDLKKV